MVSGGLQHRMGFHGDVEKGGASGKSRWAVTVTEDERNRAGRNRGTTGDDGGGASDLVLESKRQEPWVASKSAVAQG